ncbi:hypothetical protein RhiLY_10821 [Ceratobasidium sp. AG-Ba]|nr:hypothetical protein RhiLY_10821 [Ceratobasidium sp. AG-Ba]
MSSMWWTRRASASDTANPPRAPIRNARSFDPSQPSASTSSSTPRTRTTSNSGLTVIAHALGLGGSSLNKSKSRERLRDTGVSSTPEQPSLIHTATFFASGAGAAPIAASSIAASSRRVPKSSVGSLSSRIPTSANRQTVVSTESGSSFAATSSVDRLSMWEPATPSSGSDAKNSFQSVGMPVGEDPFARGAPATVYVSKGKAPESSAEKPRKKDKMRERKLAVSAGSGALVEDGSVSPLSLSPMSAFPSPPESTGAHLLPRRAASAVASGSNTVARPPPQRSNSAQPRPGTSPHLYTSQPSPLALPTQTLRLTPPTQTLHLTPPTQTIRLTPPTQTIPLTPPSGSPNRPRTSPSLRVDVCSPLQMHAHASALLDTDSIMGEEDDAYDVRLREPVSPRSRTACALGLGIGMSNMTAIASDIVTGLEEQAGRKSSAGQLSVASTSSGGGGKVPPKRPSRSELRERPSAASLQTSSNTITPPVRQSSLNPAPQSLYPAPRRAATDGVGRAAVDGIGGPSAAVGRSAIDGGDGSMRRMASGALTVVSSGSGLSGTSGSTSPSTSTRPSPTVSSVTTPNASLVSTPNASSVSVQRPRTRDTTPTSPSPVKQLGMGERGLAMSLEPVAGPSVPRPTTPPPRESEELIEDLDHYVFAPITDTDSASVDLTDENGQEEGDEDHWLPLPLDDGLHLGTRGVSQTTKYGRRPPPSPTNLPWMAGNAGRRPTRRDVVYPSGVHVIPMAALSDLARMGQEEDAVVTRTVVEDEVEPPVQEPSSANLPLSAIDEKFPTPPASAPRSSPSPIHPLTRISSMSTGSIASSCSSFAPEVIPPQTISSRVEFSRHVRSGSYSDSELDFDDKRPRGAGKSRLGSSGSLLPQTTNDSTTTSTSVAWRCASGNSGKCCGNRSMVEGQNTGAWKCCAERATAGAKNARCCASFVGRPCERARVSSTSSASVHEAAKALKRQRSFHLSSLPGIGPAPTTAVPSPSGGGRRNRFFHRPHTSHGKATASALAEDDSRSVWSVKSKEDPGPSGSISAIHPEDLFGTPGRSTVASPPMSPLARQEFRAQYILSPAKLNDHLKKEAVVAPAPVPAAEPPAGMRSPRLEPVRQRSNTTATVATDTSGSHRSIISTHSTDSPVPMRSLLPPRRVHNTLPSMSTPQTVDQPRRYVRSVSTVSQPPTNTGPPPPPRSPAIMPHSAPATGSGLPPPPRGRVGMQQPIVSFISSRSTPTPRASEVPGLQGLSLKHRSSKESYESASTVRRPVQMSFLDVEEESDEEDEEEVNDTVPERPDLHHTQSFLDLSGRRSGDTMRENDAMFA